MEKIVIQQSAPINTDQKPKVRLDLSEFESLIWQHGYNCLHDKIMKCPCQIQNNIPNSDEGSNTPSIIPDAFGQHYNNSLCRNCNGTGYIFINRVKTKIVLQGMNLDTRYKEWSEERTGIVKVTCLERDRISFMDRIINLDSESNYNETLTFQDHKGEMFNYLVYEPTKVLVAFLYIDNVTKLKLLIEGVDFSIDQNKFILKKCPPRMELRNLKVSIKYKHHPVFHIIDMLRDVMSQESKDKNEGIVSKFPIHSIARRAHYILDMENYNQDLIINNIQECEF